VRPVVAADGFCPACGRPAPIAAYLENMRLYGGYLVLDDTQALGILGHKPGPQAPYGRGGGGSLRWSHVSGPDVIAGSSLAKGFGVPVAVLAGRRAMVRRFEQASATRTHCSPPSNAVIHAAEHALAVNRVHGDHVRLQLWKLVGRLSRGLTEAGLSVHGGRFPVQTLTPALRLDSTKLHEKLLQRGIRTVLHRARDGFRAQITFLITALHRFQDIDKATEAVKQVAQLEEAALEPPEGSHEQSIQL
jgi:8-amino-7-oxononanoate synthase